MQRRLLAKTDLCFQKALDIAIVAETAKKNVLDLRTSFTSGNAVTQGAWKNDCNKKNMIQRKTTKVTSKKPCFRCGKAYAPSECRFVTAECRFCKKKGHIERVCLSEGKLTIGSSTSTKKSGESSTHAVMNTSRASTQREVEYQLNTIQEVLPSEIFTVEIYINEKPLSFEVDSGANCTIISEKTFKRLWPTRQLKFQKESITLRTWTRQQLEVRGTFIAKDTKIKYMNYH